MGQGVRSRGGRVLAAVKGEPVLAISALCAAASMLLNPPSAEYLGFVDVRVLVLLFCLMAVVAGLQGCGVFAVLAQKLLRGERSLPLLSLALVLLPFFSAMLVTNDVALITFVPFAILVLNLIGRQERLAYLVVLQTLAANLGSMATPVGNPQNLYLYARYSLSAGDFFAAMIPLTVISLIGLAAAALLVRRETIRVSFPEPAQLRRPGCAAALGGLFVVCLLCVFHVIGHWVLLAIVLAAVLVLDRSLLRRVDYALLLTFVCFFIFAGNIGANPTLRGWITGVLAQNTALTAGAASQIISNVPAAVLLSGFTEDWKGLLLGTNLGGLGTPIASLASLISLRFYCKVPGARPGRYLALFTLANVAGLAVLTLCAWLLG